MPRKDPFFGVALAFGLLAATLFVVVAFAAFRYGSISKEPGWRAVPDGAAWVVDRVDPRGPVAGMLFPGDRIVALDGDARIGRIGPHWVLPALSPGSSYSLTVRRGSGLVTLSPALADRIDRSFRGWSVVYLFVAAVNFVLALIFGLARPESRTARYGFAACALFGQFMLWQALRPYDGVLQDSPLALALVSCVPLYMIFFYLFMARFRTSIPGGPVWRAVTATIVGLGVLIWIARTANNALMAFDTPTTVDLVDRYYALLWIHPRIVRPLEGLHVAMTGIACCAVQIRNYRRITLLDERRRIVWAIVGLVAGMAPLAAVGTLDALARAAGWSGTLAGFLDVGKKIGNAAVVLVPASMGYAILRHRVLGVRVALGMGLKYLLAKNLLRLALIAPLAWIAVTTLSDAEATVGQAMTRAARPVNLALVGLVAAGLVFRTRLLRAIDRHFFRDERGREGALARLSESLRTSTSLANVLASAASEVGSALHPDRVVAFDRRGERLVPSVTHGVHGALPAIESDSALGSEWNAVVHSASPEEMSAAGSRSAADWMAAHGLHLAVPIFDDEDRLVGILLVGKKRSEQPYSSADREFLRAVAVQIGAAHEVISLRDRVDRDRDARRDVLARLESEGVECVRECPTCHRCFDPGASVCDADGAELVVEMPVPRILDGKYRLDRLVGRGGMGAVYRAEDLRLNRPVAVKVVIDRLYGRGPASRRFLREAQVTARLEHANLTRLYDYAAIPDTGAYLVLEYLSGPTLLAELDRRGRFDPAAAREIVDPLLAGVEAAHAAGILHRDLKPGNVVLSRSERGESVVKILDFGLAKVRDAQFADPKSRTEAGVALGTLGYMSPEQLHGQTVDERTDVYALGVIVLELLTGRVRHRTHGFHATTRTRLAERLGATGIDPALRRVHDVLSDALAEDAGDRIPSVAELRSRLLPALAACGPWPEATDPAPDGRFGEPPSTEAIERD